MDYLETTGRTNASKIMSTQCFVILGPSRTGTSLCAGLIRELGVWLGDRLLEDHQRYAPNRFYYEDVELVNFIQKGESSPEAIVRRLERDKWGIKSPQLINVWHEFSPFLGSPKFIVCYRNIRSVTHSQQRWIDTRRTNLDIIQLVHDYYQDTERIIQGLPRIDINYDYWFTSRKEGQLQTLADFVDGSVTSKVESLIDPSLRRS